MKALIFTLSAGLVACGANSKPGHPSSRPVPLGQEFELATGQTVQVGDGIRVTFDAVRNDSRCPVDVTCVWEGDATVALRVVRPPQAPAALELHTSGGAGSGEREYEGHRVRLVKLMPVPRSGSTPEQSAYRVTLVVTAS